MGRARDGMAQGFKVGSARPLRDGAGRRAWAAVRAVHVVCGWRRVVRLGWCRR